MTSSISGHLLEEIDLIVEKRPVENRNDRLGCVDGQRAQACAFAPCQKDRLHDNQPYSIMYTGYEASQATGVVECRVPMNLPNTLTLVRMFLVPLLVVVLLTEFEGRQILGMPKEFAGAGIFAIASITDWLDGYLARRRRQVTWLGQMLDPIADKLLTSAAFISLVQLGLAPAWMVALIIGREFAITALRSLAYTQGHHHPRVTARQDQDGVAGHGDPAADCRRRAAAVAGPLGQAPCGW